MVQLEKSGVSFDLRKRGGQTVSSLASYDLISSNTYENKQLDRSMLKLFNRQIDTNELNKFHPIQTTSYVARYITTDLVDCQNG